jgi:A/G-specific adenine glycosylase
MIDSLEKLDALNKKEFQHDLIEWFKSEQRDLPWRKGRDPYKIWVSEIMLQQTRVETVIPYFNRFVEQFPTIQALSEAEEEKVLKAWEGLGYYSRVRNLQSAVKEVHEKYGDKVPDSLKEISALKGVGPYTAGAILSIAYGIPAPAVDGNVMRVLSRILSVWEDIAKPSSRKIFEAAVKEMISQDNPSFFNQGLMELGALICTPTSPSCLLCPVMEHCNAFEEGVQNELPVKTKGKKQRKVQLAAVILTNEEGQTIIHKRPDKGLLASLWEFPNVEVSLPFLNDKTQLQDMLKEKFCIQAEVTQKVGNIEHVFSHLIWDIKVYEGKILAPFEERNDLRLVSPSNMTDYPFPVSYQKMIKQFYLAKQ